VILHGRLEVILPSTNEIMEKGLGVYWGLAEIRAVGQAVKCCVSNSSHSF